jgi:hypothetical protein
MTFTRSSPRGSTTSMFPLKRGNTPASALKACVRHRGSRSKSMFHMHRRYQRARTRILSGRGSLTSERPRRARCSASGIRYASSRHLCTTRAIRNLPQPPRSPLVSLSTLFVSAAHRHAPIPQILRLHHQTACLRPILLLPPSSPSLCPRRTRTIHLSFPRTRNYSTLMEMPSTTIRYPCLSTRLLRLPHPRLWMMSTRKTDSHHPKPRVCSLILQVRPQMFTTLAPPLFDLFLYSYLSYNKSLFFFSAFLNP